jgi:hypothetical protein
MTVTTYRSFETGAPTLNGQPGSLVAVLDACLVNGYGSKAAAGWTKAFSATNRAVYRAPTGTQYYLAVDDTAPISRYATLRGYETMSDTVTGTNPFPSVAQLSTGLPIGKSDTADSGVRGWCVIAHERSFYFFAYPSFGWGADNYSGNSAAGFDNSFFFGELVSYMSTADTYNSFLIRDLTRSFQTSNEFSSWSVSMNGHYGARSFDGTKVSHGFAKGQVGNPASSNSIIVSGGSFPEWSSGEAGLNVIEILEHSPSSSSPAPFSPRGRLPGFYSAAVGSVPRHQPFAGTTGPRCIFSGAGPAAGRQFIMMGLPYDASYSPSGGLGFFEVTDNWYTL